MTETPHHEATIGIAAGIVVVSAFAAITASKIPGPFGMMLPWLIIMLAIYLCVRAILLAITVTDNAVTIRGLWRTRTVPRDDVLSMSGTPSLRWKSRTGRTRTTPILALAGINRTRSHGIEPYTEASIARVKDALNIQGSTH